MFTLLDNSWTPTKWLSYDSGSWIFEKQKTWNNIWVSYHNNKNVYANLTEFLVKRDANDNLVLILVANITTGTMSGNIFVSLTEGFAYYSNDISNISHVIAQGHWESG